MTSMSDRLLRREASVFDALPITAPTLAGLVASATFAEDDVLAAPQLLDADVTFADTDGDLDGATLTVSGLLAEDRVAVRSQGAGAGEISVSGSDILYGGIVIGSFAGGAGTTFSVTFNAGASAAAVEALIENLTYANVSEAPTPSRTLLLNVTDAAGTDLGPAPGPPVFAPAVNSPFTGFAAPNIAFGDLDGDGDEDLVLGDEFGTVAVLRNDGGGTFTPLTGAANPFDGLTFGLSTAPALADIDGDGDVDAVVGNRAGTLRTFRNEGGALTELTGAANPFDGVILGGNTPFAGIGYSAPAFIDVDGDGDFDLVAGQYDGLLRTFRNSDGSFTELTGADNPFDGIDLGGETVPAPVDLDGDGDADLAVITMAGTLSAFRNNGDGSFTALAGAANPLDGVNVGTFANIGFGDTDGDGDIDALISAPQSGFVTRLLLLENVVAHGQAIHVDVTPQNDAPVLTGIVASASFGEQDVNAAPQLLDADVAFVEPEEELDGATLTVSGLLAEDNVGLRDEGAGAGQVGTAGSHVTYGGTVIGTLAGGSGSTFTITFNADATSAAVEAVIENLTYANASDSPTANRTLTLDLVDPHGVGLDSGGAAIAVSVASESDAPTIIVTPRLVPSGGELLLNSTISGGQSQPTVAALPSGGFVAAWVTQDGLGKAITAQLYDAAGAKLGDEIPIVASSELYEQPCLAVLPSGGFVVCWMGPVGSTFGFGPDIYVQLFDATGTPGDAVVVNADLGPDQFQPSIATLASGGFVVTWTEGVPGALNVRAQMFDESGDKVGGEILIAPLTNGDQNLSSVTALESGGFVVTWRETGGITFPGDPNPMGGDGSGAAIKAQIYDSAGAAVGGELLVNTVTTGEQSLPKITALAAGGFVVTWQDASGQGGDASGTAIKGQLFDASGAAVGGEFLINTASLNAQSEPAVAALPAGGFMISWTDASGEGGDASGTAIKAQLFDAWGSRVGDEFRVNAETLNSQSDPQIVVLESGAVVVTWTDLSGQGGDASGSAIKGRILDPIVFEEQVVQSLKGTIGIDDVDSGATPLTVTLTVDHGILTVAAGSSGAAVAGSGTGTVTVTGTLAQVRALLGTDPTSLVTFRSDGDDPPETAMLQVTASDGEAVGTASLVLDVLPINDAPAGEDATRVIDVDEVYAVGIADFGFSDVDGNALGAVHITNVAGNGTFLLDGVAITGSVTVSAADLAAGKLSFVPDPGSSGADYARLSFRVVDDGGTANGGIDTDPIENLISFTVAAINDAPELDLNGAGAGTGSTIAAGEGDPLTAIAAAAIVTDSDSADFDGGRVTAAITGGAQPWDRLDIIHQGDGAGLIGVAGSAVSYGGIGIGSWAYSSDTQALVVTLNANASAAAVEALTRQIGYRAIGDQTTTGSRTVSLSIEDGDGGSVTRTATIDFTAVDGAPVAQPDAIGLLENAVFAGNVFAANGSGPDLDADGPALQVAAVNGSAANVGTAFRLASGAKLRLNADGSFVYDTDAKFNWLAAANSGAITSTFMDQFTYTLAGGNTVTVSVAINGLDSKDLLTGTAGADIMFGGGYNDRLFGLDGDDNLQGGSGSDLLEGSAGSDTLQGGLGNDRLDGGTGADLMIGGNGHDTHVVDHAGDVVVETGSNGNDTVESAISYALPAHVEQLVLTGAFSRSGHGNGMDNKLFGNGGNNFLYGGSGDDRIDGGAGKDSLYGGPGRDVLIGGTGEDRFIFNTAPGGDNVDRILDYQVGEDILYIAHYVFTRAGRPRSELDAEAFQLGAAALEADDRILYDPESGGIFYDPDGSGAAAAILFATVTAGLPLTSADFYIYT